MQECIEVGVWVCVYALHTHALYSKLGEDGDDNVLHETQRNGKEKEIAVSGQMMKSMYLK
jgi:hypothetical protein